MVRPRIFGAASLAAALMTLPALAQDTDRKTAVGYPSVQAAFDALSAKPGVKVSTSNGWTRITDPSTKTVWSFVPKSHAAHPAVIKQHIKQTGREISVSLDALCQAEKVDCDNLWAAATVQNERFKKRLQRQVAARASRFSPSEKMQEAAKAALTAFLEAYDAGDFDRAYAMLAPAMKASITQERYRDLGVRTHERITGAANRETPKESWYVDPPNAPVKGVVAAFDIKCGYENMAVCKETLLLHQQTDGSFLVLRHEAVFIDADTMKKIMERQQQTSQ